MREKKVKKQASNQCSFYTIYLVFPMCLFVYVIARCITLIAQWDSVQCIPLSYPEKHTGSQRAVFYFI